MPEENRKSKWIYVRWFAIRFFLVVYDIIAVNAACYLALLTRFYVAKQFHSAAAYLPLKWREWERAAAQQPCFRLRTHWDGVRPVRGQAEGKHGGDADKERQPRKSPYDHQCQP